MSCDVSEATEGLENELNLEGDLAKGTNRI